MTDLHTDVSDVPEAEGKGKAVRHEVDQVVRTGDVHQICDAIQLHTARLTGDGEHHESVRLKTGRIVQVFRETRDRMRAAGMFRYLMEGKSYRAEVAPVIDFLEREGYLNGPQTQLFDLGAGPGQMVQAWKETGRPARGVDLSPSFVADNPDLRLALIDDDYSELLDALDGDFKPDLIMTSMTLDRVRKPKQLLANVTNLARQYNSPFVVSTILPIHPEDDDASAEVKIIYTDPDHLLTPGRSEEEDKNNILEYLQELAADYDVTVHTLPYVIHSSGVRHEYTQYCFCGRPKA